MLTTLVTLSLNQEVSLAFRPDSSKLYTFQSMIVRELFSGPRTEVNSSDEPLRTLYTSRKSQTDLRFTRKGKVYAVHGRAKGTETNHTFESPKPNTFTLENVVIGGRFDAKGWRVGDLSVRLKGNPNSGLGGLYDETFNRLDFMGVAYPKTKIKKESTWVTKVDGQTYSPNGEMIKTSEGQTVEYHFRVLDIRKQGSQTLIDLERTVDTKIKFYAVQIDDRYEVEVHEKDLITLDAKDGIVVSAEYRVSENRNGSGSSDVIKIRRLS